MRERDEKCDDSDQSKFKMNEREKLCVNLPTIIKSATKYVKTINR